MRQNAVQSASSYIVICVKLCAYLTQIATQYASYGELKRKKSAPHLAFTEKQNNGFQFSMSIITKTFNCFFCSAGWCFSHMISTLLTSPYQYERYGVKSL
ncbi:hypothetical protein HMPREF0971_01582 [Segatella oris F0302]|uniref:Uncharacterized protein n=1 Tax=Segatella oris F0302 TaxID=649760 RepID=D1QRH6_9BACT|nr:hypothetical protein HMPREF0971_01582 [Segatella oris F0302]